MVFSKSDRTKYHHFPMLFFPMNINYKKWWHKAVVFTGNGGTKCHHSIFGRGIRGMFP